MAACFSCVGAFAPSIDFLANSSRTRTSVVRAVYGDFSPSLEQAAYTRAHFLIIPPARDSILNLTYSWKLIKHVRLFGKFISNVVRKYNSVILKRERSWLYIFTSRLPIIFTVKDSLQIPWLAIMCVQRANCIREGCIEMHKVTRREKNRINRY